MNSVLSINERANPHCEELALSNLVKLEAHQMWDDSSTEPHHLVNPPSTDCFNGDSETNLTQETEVIRPDHDSRRTVTFKAVCNQRTPVSDSDCFRKGATLLVFPCWRNPAFVGGVERYYVTTDAVDHCKGCLSRVRDLYVGAIESVRPPFTKAVTHWRCFRVSSDCGEVIPDDVCRGIRVAPQTFPLLSCTVADERGTAITFRTNSSQVDRILSLNKAKLASSGAVMTTPCPVGVCRIDWVAQLQQLGPICPKECSVLPSCDVSGLVQGFIQ